MKSLWIWKGTFFGHRDKFDLWTYDGRNAGRFYDDEVYGPDGRYLGEIVHNNRLISCLKNKSLHKEVFAPYDSVRYAPAVSAAHLERCAERKSQKRGIQWQRRSKSSPQVTFLK